MRANKANIQHAATKITNMPYWEQWPRLLFLNELNSNYVRCFGVPACSYMDIFSSSLLRILSAHSLILWQIHI